MRPRAPALAPLEVAVRRRGNALARGGHVGIHAQAHRAAGAAPVEPGAPEHLVEALALGLRLDLLRARDDHRVEVARHLPAIDDRGRRAEIADARVRARADEHAGELDL